MDTKDLLGDDSSPIVPPSSDEKTMALLSHILTLVSAFIAPLVIYLVKKDDSSFVAEHAKESLNFQITAFILSIPPSAATCLSTISSTVCAKVLAEINAAATATNNLVVFICRFIWSK